MEHDISETQKAFKERSLIILLLLISAIERCLYCTYGLPYSVHVDESLIIKDPLKILIAYKNLDFHLTYNLYDYLLLFWHGIIFLLGRIAGIWHSTLEYENMVAVNSPVILFSFRLLNVLLSTAGDYFLIRFVYKKLNTPASIKLLSSCLILLNPIVLNSANFVKFDAFCYLFYVLSIYLGYLYFVERKPEYRNKLYLVLFLGISIRIEMLSFLLGYFMYDFFVIHKHNLKLFFSKLFIKELLLNTGLYLLITLYPVAVIYNLFFIPKINYSHTQTFEAVIFSHIRWTSIAGYMYYVKVALMLLGPVVILPFFIKLFQKNNAISFLIPVLAIDTGVLALDYVKDIWYFLLPSIIIIFIFIKYIENLRNKKIALELLVLVFLYFLSYSGELLHHLMQYNANNVARQVTLDNTLPNDTILIVGACDLRIPQSAQILGEQITALKQTGGSTGYGLINMLKDAERHPSTARSLFYRDSDYFWTGTKYYEKWLTGYDTTRLNELKPKLCVIFSNISNLHDVFSQDENVNANTQLEPYLNTHYILLSQYSCTFPDPRLYYRNYYYLPSCFIFKRK